MKLFGGMALACALASVAAAEPYDLGVYIHRVPSKVERAVLDTDAKFEPPYGAYLGAFIDLDSTLTDRVQDSTGRFRTRPRVFEQIVGRPHASYFFYLGYGTAAPIDWIGYLSLPNRVVHIALEPNLGLQVVQDNAYLRKLADDLHATGAPIFLRFASEMNGDWVAWNGDPEQYIEKWRLVAKIMHERAPNVAMVWCPYALPASQIDRYYPGDEAVDWVAVNLYNVSFFNQNPKSPGAQVSPADLLRGVYDKYSLRKPIMVGEYGVSHFSALENSPIVEFASGNLASLYRGLPRRFPRVKCINYFNGNGIELAHRRNNNYAVTQNPLILSLYKRLIQDDWFLSEVPPEAIPPQPAGVRVDLAVAYQADPEDWPFIFRASPVAKAAPPKAPVKEPVKEPIKEPVKEPVKPPVKARPSRAYPEPPAWRFPLVPLSVRPEEPVSGKIRLSAWADSHDFKAILRLRVGGITVFEGSKSEAWEAEIDTKNWPEGKIFWTAELLRGGKAVAVQRGALWVERAD